MLNSLEPSALQPLTENKVYHIRYAAETRNIVIVLTMINIAGVIAGLVVWAVTGEYNFGASFCSWLWAFVLGPMFVGNIPLLLERNKEGFVLVKYSGQRSLLNSTNIAQIQTAEIKKWCGGSVTGQCYVQFVLKAGTGCGKMVRVNLEETTSFLDDTGLQPPAASKIMMTNDV